MNNKYKILFIEDDGNIRSVVTTLLETEGYQVILADTCEMGKAMFASYLPDVVILDLGLPDRDGMQFLEFVRQDSLTPVMVLSARTTSEDKVKALDAGANDYITKPFGSDELLARIRMILRNYHHRPESSKLPGKKFQLRDLSIDYDARQVFIGGKEIRLSQTEYNIVALLSANCGKMMSYTAIIKAIWATRTKAASKNCR